MFKNLKTWKTVIQFIITVLTAVVSSFLTQSCMNCHTDLTDLTDALCYNSGHTDLTDLTDFIERSCGGHAGLNNATYIAK